MAKFLRPRRGSARYAIDQNIELKSGEIYFEVPEGTMVGRTPGRLVMGDGTSLYSSLNYVTTATDRFQPFITDPSLYVPQFNNSTYATSGWTYKISTASIDSIGNGGTASTTRLPQSIGAIKETLCNHEDSLHDHELRIGNSQTTVSGIISSVSTLNNNVNKLSTSVSNLNSTVSTLNTAITGLTTTASRLNTSVSNLNTTAVSLNNNVTNLNASVSNLNTTVSNLNSSVSALWTATSNMMSTVITTKNTADANYDNIQSLTTAVYDHENRISDLEAGGGGGGGGDYSALRTSVASLWQDNIDNIANINWLITTVTDIDSYVYNLASSCATTFSRLNTTASRLTTSVSNLNTSVSNLNTTASRLNTSVSNLNTTASNLVSSINNIDGTLDAIDDKFNVWEKYCTIHANISANYGASGLIYNQSDATMFLNTLFKDSITGNVIGPHSSALGNPVQIYMDRNFRMVTGMTSRGLTTWYIAGFNWNMTNMDTEKPSVTLISEPVSYSGYIFNNTGSAQSNVNIYTASGWSDNLDDLMDELRSYLGNTLYYRKVFVPSSYDANLDSRVGTGKKGASTGATSISYLPFIIPNEVNLFGNTIMSSSYVDCMYNNTQLPLFKMVDYYSFKPSSDWVKKAVVLSNFSYCTDSGSKLYFARCRPAFSPSNEFGGVDATNLCMSSLYRIHFLITLALP